MALPKKRMEILLNGGLDANEHAEAQSPMSFRDLDGYRFGELGRLEQTPGAQSTWTLAAPSGSAWTASEVATTLFTRGDEVAFLSAQHGVGRLVGSSVDWCRRKRALASSPDHYLSAAPQVAPVSRRIVHSAQFARASQWIHAATCTRTHSGDLLIAWIEGATSGADILCVRVYSTTTGQQVSSTTETIGVTNGPYSLRACRYSVSGAEGAIVTVCPGGAAAPMTITAYRYDEATREMVTGGTLTSNASHHVHDVLYNQNSPYGFVLAFNDNTTGFLTVQTRTIGAVASTHLGTHAMAISGVSLVQGSSNVLIFSCTGTDLYAEVLGTPAGAVSIFTVAAPEVLIGVTGTLDAYPGDTVVATAFVTVLDTNVSTTYKTVVSTVEFDGTIGERVRNTQPNTYPATGAFTYGGRAYCGMTLFNSVPSAAYAAGNWPTASGVIVRTADGGRVDAIARFAHDRLTVSPGSYYYGAPCVPYVDSSGNAHVVSLGDVSPDKTTTVGAQFPQTIFWHTLTVGQTASQFRPVQWIEHDGTTLLAAGQLVDYDGVLCSEAQPMCRPSLYYSGAAGALGAKAIYRWVDAAGKLHRSAPSAAITNLTAAGTVYVSVPPFATYDGSTAQAYSVELYVTDGSTGTYYLANTAAGYRDDYDATSTGGQWFEFQNVQTGSSANPQLYTEGGVLASEPPPPLYSIARVGDRLFGIDAEDRRRIHYTKPLQTGYAPEWNSVLNLRLPTDAECVVSLGGLPTFLCVDSVWQVAGEGPDETNVGGFTPARKLSETGCVQRQSVCETPYGVAFLARSGYVLLGGGGDVQPIGLPVEPWLNVRETDASGTATTVYRTIYDQSRNELRVTTPYQVFRCSLANGAKWSKSTTFGLDTVISRAGRVYQSYGATVYSELKKGDASYRLRASGSNFWKTPWQRVEGIAGFGRLYQIVLALSAPAEVASLSGTGFVIRLYTDYDETTVRTTWTIPGTDIATWTASVAKMLTLNPSVQRMRAFRLSVTESITGSHSGFAPLSQRLEYGVDPRGSKYQQPKTPT